MAYLYELEIQSFCNGEECERYGIGIFRTREEAESTAQRYLREVKGFRDYYCEYTVREAELIGNEDIAFVYTWLAWNVDADENEIDILYGQMYRTEDDARTAMEAAHIAHERQEWDLSRWQIGHCEWAEGFDREYPDGTPAPTLPELRKELRSLIESRSICGIEFEYSDNVQYFFPLDVSQQLFLAAVDDDFLLNGFTVRRLRDIFELDVRKGIYQTISEKEGLTNFEAPHVDITDWLSVFTSLQKLGKHIIVEREYEPDFFRLGVIEAVAENHVLLRHYDADGIWQEPAVIPYREITSVTIDDRYAITFSKYV